MAGEFVIDVEIAPEAALARIAANINRRQKRAFGIFKTENEYVGIVRGGGFEIWERQQRAVHGRGRVRALRGGTRIEMRLLLPLRTQLLIVVFFGLYALVSAGIALRPPESSISLEEIAIATAGALVLAIVFAAAARRQGANLRAFVARLFGDLRLIDGDSNGSSRR